ncbi:hypothetical protein BD770DRAFT_442720 [Pilaira anomala]|nr:hypothetical protein BD770DRAFT_442720 [Pilaira anomala]
MTQQETGTKKPVHGLNWSESEDEPVRPVGIKKAKVLAAEQEKRKRREELGEEIKNEMKVSNNLIQSKRSDAKEAFEAHIMATNLASLTDNWSQIYFYRKKKAIYEHMCKENGLQVEEMRLVTGLTTEIEKGVPVEEVNEVKIQR